MEKFTDSNSDFALKLFKQVSKDGKSSFLSPASITAALAMTYAGAEGNTKGQMNQLMFKGLNDQEINDGMHAMIKAINEPVDGYTLRTANRLYVEKSYQILQTFLDVVQKHYQSDCIAVNFVGNSAKVGSEINQWVEQVTNDKIKDLIKPGILTPDTRLVLANAIYFKGDWIKEFDEKDTRKMPFHLTSEKTVDVDMMHMKMKHFEYMQTEKCQVLCLPYKSPDVAMYFVLPKSRNALHELEKELTGPELIKLFRQTRSAEVEVDLPKFKLEHEMSLVEPFTELGCKDMFNKDSDFSKISDGRDLFVSEIIHKAFIEVNEKGAEAAAASAVVMTKRCKPRPQELIRFVADHPFMFAIMEHTTTSILFLGHYYG